AYGVPAIALTDIDVDWFKYDDYYFSTGRFSYNKALSVDDALNMDADEIPDFERMRSSLLASFPKDLWEANVAN
ncbi:MAG: polysaccharide pyruvyl transferase family protein, partial [Nitrososphaerales archaeon]